MISRILNKIKRSYKVRSLYRKIIKADVMETKIMDLEEKVIYDYIYKLQKRVEILEKNERADKPVFKKLIDFEGETPSLEHPCSQVATFSQLKSPIYEKWCSRLKLPLYKHRKTWEFVYIAEVLEQKGFLKDKKTGVGFGVGKDPIIAYFVSKGVNILATDLHEDRAQQAGWVKTNQYSKSLMDLNERGVTTDKEMTKKVEFQHVDMNAIPTDIKEYDFAWSACAFEHLGSIEQGLEFVKNSLKCVKPGGVVVHTTEFNLTSNDDTLTSGPTVLFRKKDFEKLSADLKADGHEIEFNFNHGNSPMDLFYDVPPYSDYTHLKLELDKYVTTSIGITVKKVL